MHRLLKRFAGYVSSGEIKEMQPIPNNIFTKEELEYLWNNGRIADINNQFVAMDIDNLE